MRAFRLTFLTALFAGLLFFSDSAQAQQRFALTPHVPQAVARGQAALVGGVPATQRMSLAISLPLRNEADLDDLLQQLYDPQSPNYRRYLTVEEFTQRFGPTLDDRDAVVRFAEASGLTVTRTPANRSVVDIEGPVANIEAAFHLNMGVYRHPTEARTFYAPDREPTLNLDVPVLHISGLDNFTLPHAKNIKHLQLPEDGKSTGSGPHGQFIGSDMRAAYYGSGPLTGAGQTVGLFEYAGYEVSDVQLYFQKVNQPLNVPIVGVRLNGVPLQCPPSECDDSEQVLDIEMAISMAPGLSQVVVYVGSSDVSIFSQMAADNTSKQLSCSWGWSDDESSLDPDLQGDADTGADCVRGYRRRRFRHARRQRLAGRRSLRRRGGRHRLDHQRSGRFLGVGDRLERQRGRAFQERHSNPPLSEASRRDQLVERWVDDFAQHSGCGRGSEHQSI
jgi:xanthomonalisin